MIILKDGTTHCALAWGTSRGPKVMAPPSHSLVSERMLQEELGIAGHTVALSLGLEVDFPALLL